MTTAKVRRTRAPVRPQRYRHLGNAKPVYRRLDDHLAGEFHSQSLKIEAQNRRAVEAAQATMEVSARALKEPPAQRRQHRISKIAVQPRHSARFDAACKAVTHH